jgi:serine/threonine protein kinase
MSTIPGPTNLYGCPSRDQLFAFSVGRLARDHQEFIAGHIESCGECLAILETLDDSADLLIATARKPVASELLSEMIDRGCRTRPHREQGPSGRGNQLNPSPPRQLGDYRIHSLLGSGGMGTVYLAVHSRLGKQVALKVLRPERLHEAKWISRFQREMRAMGKLDHPNLVRALDAREEGGLHLLVMEYLQGSDLARIVERCGSLSVADACEVLRQAALGLQHAHERCQVVHRDLKPSNLMITTDGGVKVLDLGLARVVREQIADGDVEAASLTSECAVMGTVDYMAPEQWNDSHAVDLRADLYSLGCTLYYLLSGSPPFAAPEYRSRMEKMIAHAQATVPPLRLKRPEIPGELVTIVERLLAKKPEERFATPGEVAETLKPFTRGCDLPKLVAASAESLPSICEPDIPKAVTSLIPSFPDPRHKPALRSRIVLCALAFLALGCTLAMIWGRFEPAKLKEMKIYIWREADRDGLPSYRSLVADGRDLEAEPIQPPLGPGDFFQLAGAFERPTLWYWGWFDTEGKVSVVAKSESAQSEMEYPVGERVSVNPDDPVGVHALVLMAGSGDMSAELLENRLRGLGRPPPLLPGRWAIHLRGPGSRKPAPSDLAASRFLQVIKDRMPRGLDPVYVVFLQTRE